MFGMKVWLLHLVLAASQNFSQLLYVVLPRKTFDSFGWKCLHLLNVQNNISDAAGWKPKQQRKWILPSFSGKPIMGKPAQAY